MLHISRISEDLLSFRKFVHASLQAVPVLPRRLIGALFEYSDKVLDRVKAAAEPDFLDR